MQTRITFVVVGVTVVLLMATMMAGAAETPAATPPTSPFD
jgi:hypothetical protein